MRRGGVILALAAVACGSSGGEAPPLPEAHDFVDDIRINPSMWRYAKKAGFRTVYIDGQRHHGHLHNLMTPEELADVDQLIQLDTELKPFQKDVRIAQILVDLLKTGEAARFVFINKMGSHFPYEGKYPPDQAVYRPTMSSNYSGNEVDPQNLARPSDEQADMRRRFKNSYLNSVRWNTREFFRTVLAEIDIAHTVLVYTADHGQDLHEDGRPGYGTHCTDGPAVAVEGMVPLRAVRSDVDVGSAGINKILRTAVTIAQQKIDIRNRHTIDVQKREIFSTLLRIARRQPAVSLDLLRALGQETGLEPDRVPPAGLSASYSRASQRAARSRKS